MFTLIRFGSIIGILCAIDSFVDGASAKDAEHGAQIFNMCAACHATDNSTRLGPSLHGIVGRRSATVSGFRYSRAMKNANITWDEKSLDEYIAEPQGMVPGTTIALTCIASYCDRADLIAYLETLR